MKSMRCDLAIMSLFVAGYLSVNVLGSQQVVNDQPITASTPFEGISLPFAGRAEVTVLDNGWIELPPFERARGSK